LSNQAGVRLVPGINGSWSLFRSVGLIPWGDLSEYVHTVIGKALDLNEDEVGTIILKLVSTTEAENQGER
jgi:hypothetical protein